MSPQGSISHLPSHLLIAVLSRLPAKTVIHCRCVCKSWLKLLSGPEFVKLHLSRSPNSLIINRFYSPSDACELLQLMELEDMIDHHDHFHYDPAMMFDHSSINSQIVLLGSSNGLILLNSLTDDSLYVCNPIMREYITLPRAQGIRRYPNLIEHGFGYSSRSDQYKVIRIYQEQTTDPTTGAFLHCKSEVQVYTLGSGSWRSVGHVYLAFGCRSPGVQLNGNLHWLVNDPKGCEPIFSFDLDRESFQSLPPPPGLNNNIAGTLGVLDGRLCLCNNATDFDLELWIMKEYGVKKSWNKQFVISKSGDYWLCYIFVKALTVFKDGEILFLWRDYSLFSYHPEKKTIKEYDIFKGNGATVDVLSVLSLKTFLGEEVKKF